MNPLRIHTATSRMRRRGLLLTIVATVVVQIPASSQIPSGSPLTRAERTAYVETSSYEDVIAFSSAMASQSRRLHMTTFGYSLEGRALPLLVYGDVADASPEAVLGSGKTRVFVQANIHAGEVCGKEALLLLLRDLATGAHASWADSLVLLFAPIYNADGNERVRLTNRGLQNGPVGGMGQRPNAQELDLNRDHMKLDSPEARSLVGLFNRYDPHVIVDLHTTNGTHHGYHLTYAPPLHPNTPAGIDAYLRDRWLPEITDAIRSKYGWEYYHYGNVPRRGEPGWFTFDHRPRFNNNYAGLRNRFAILSEAYAYLSFEERVMATLRFVEEILDFAQAHAGEIRSITARADARRVPGVELALTATFRKSASEVPILMGSVTETRHPYTGERVFVRNDETAPQPMFEYIGFDPVETEVAPAAYAILPDADDVLDRLAAHGIRTRVVGADTLVAGARFRVDSVSVAANPYQGRRGQTVHGSWVEERVTLPTGSSIVRLDQPLGRLAFALLEPRFDDGLAAWGMVDLSGADLGSTDAYPVIRVKS